MHKTGKNNFKLDQRAIERLDLALITIRAWAKESLVEVVLFGSYAKGREHEYSSIDLLIVIKSSAQRFIERKIELERLLNEDNEMPMIDTLVYTEEEILELINKMESFVISVIDEGILLWNGFNDIDLKSLSNESLIPSRYKGTLPKLEKIYD